MNKIHEIVTARANFIKPSEEMTKRAHIRYGVCEGCKYNSGGVIELCKKCICPLQIKIFTLKTPEEGNCPKGYWEV